MGIFTCLTSGEQKCGKTKFKAIDYCRNRAYSTNLKNFTRCQVREANEVDAFTAQVVRIGVFSSWTHACQRERRLWGAGGQRCAVLARWRHEAWGCRESCGHSSARLR